MITLVLVIDTEVGLHTPETKCEICTKCIHTFLSFKLELYDMSTVCIENLVKKDNYAQPTWLSG